MQVTPGFPVYYGGSETEVHFYFRGPYLVRRVVIWYTSAMDSVKIPREKINAGIIALDLDDTLLCENLSISDYTIVPEQIFGLYDHQLTDKYTTYFIIKS